MTIIIVDSTMFFYYDYYFPKTIYFYDTIESDCLTSVICVKVYDLALQILNYLTKGRLIWL